MLVLGCTNHQSVIIDEVIRVTVINNKQGQVVLGIDVPEGIQIRGEDTHSPHRQTDLLQHTEI
ncbi:MAG: carbon storage regulator [Gammaproteobacteria bacterium]|nr:carbon storage regulator [Gammaproteobacteria bacterium]MDH3859927.1 carbon storage regulator [Gammaproteobacteria bacterium]